MRLGSAVRFRTLLAAVVVLAAAFAGWHFLLAAPGQIRASTHIEAPEAGGGPGPERRAESVAAAEGIPTDARKLLDEQNLFAAFGRARDSQRPDAWVIACQIADVCGGVTNDSLYRNEIDRRIGELNSTNAMAPEREEELRHLSKRKAALAELERRCAGFRGLGRPWTLNAIRELETRTKQSEGDIGRVLQTTELVENGRGDYGQWVRALSAAIGSRNTVAGEAAIMAMAASLFDQRLPPGERTRVSALGALTEAWWQVTGQSGQDLPALERLSLCVVGGSCIDKDGVTYGSSVGRTDLANDEREYEDLVAQYAEGLRRNDPESIFKVQPRRRIDSKK